jgi:hypothetical protein
MLSTNCPFHSPNGGGPITHHTHIDSKIEMKKKEGRHFFIDLHRMEFSFVITSSMFLFFTCMVNASEKLDQKFLVSFLIVLTQLSFFFLFY